MANHVPTVAESREGLIAGMTELVENAVDVIVMARQLQMNTKQNAHPVRAAVELDQLVARAESVAGYAQTLREEWLWGMGERSRVKRRAGIPAVFFK